MPLPRSRIVHIVRIINASAHDFMINVTRIMCVVKNGNFAGMAGDYFAGVILKLF